MGRCYPGHILCDRCMYQQHYKCHLDRVDCSRVHNSLLMHLTTIPDYIHKYLAWHSDRSRILWCRVWLKIGCWNWMVRNTSYKSVHICRNSSDNPLCMNTVRARRILRNHIHPHKSEYIYLGSTDIHRYRCIPQVQYNFLEMIGVSSI